jgi:hypothetical protein
MYTVDTGKLPKVSNGASNVSLGVAHMKLNMGS